MTATVGDVLRAGLRSLRVERVFGAPLPGVEVLEVADRLVARRLAEADGRLGGVGVAHLGDGELLVTGGPAPAGEVTVDDPHALGDALAAAGTAALAGVPRATRLRLDLDLDDRLAAAPPGTGCAAPPARWVEPPDGAVDALAAAPRAVVLAGPGVVRSGCVAGLHALAARRSLGVLNTWGAKGVYDWRSPHHLATAGLQARDFELAGFAGADLVVAVGVDPCEAPGEWRLAPVVELEPGMLDPLADRLPARDAPIERPPLFAALAQPTQAGWARGAAPLAPSRITKSYSDVLGAGGVVAADPGTAGFFVARTFATTELGSVVVPGAPDAQGFAVAIAAVSRLRAPARPCLAVVDGPIDDVSRAVLEAATALRIPVAVEVWDAEHGDAVDAVEHGARLLDVLDAPRSRLVTTAYARDQLDEFVDVAGAIVAWR
jgi:thiamine pyrophosphate-dependent acetolactate synthase large subunit-like protein